MMAKTSRFSPLSTRVRTGLRYLSAGGLWAARLPEQVQRNLRWFLYDGVLASASEAITLNYLTLFLLALGASGAQIGLMTSLASLCAALMLLPGAFLTDRFEKRKTIVLLGGGGVSRVVLLLIALSPLILKNPAAVFAIMALKVIMDGFGNLSLPAWTSLTADIVPLSWRGRYFGTRNLGMRIASMAVIFLMGGFITLVGAPLGYQIAFGLAFLFGMGATTSYARIEEPALSTTPVIPTRYSLAALWEAFKWDHNFLIFCLQAVLFYISLHIAAPFFSVHLVQNLKATAAIVGTLSIVSSTSSMLSQRYFGRMADNIGEHRLMLLIGFFIPILPLAWTLARSPWHVALINTLGGFLWAGYSLAAFNLLLNIVPPQQRALYTALYQICVAVGTALGAALGSLIVLQWGFLAAFFVSGVGRLIAAGIFARFVRKPGAPPDDPHGN